MTRSLRQPARPDNPWCDRCREHWLGLCPGFGGLQQPACYAEPASLANTPDGYAERLAGLLDCEPAQADRCHLGEAPPIDDLFGDGFSHEMYAPWKKPGVPSFHQADPAAPRRQDSRAGRREGPPRPARPASFTCDPAPGEPRLEPVRFFPVARDVRMDLHGPHSGATDGRRQRRIL